MDEWPDATAFHRPGEAQPAAVVGYLCEGERILRR